LNQNDKKELGTVAVREHPADTSRATVRDKVRELTREMKEIDGQIRDLEVQAAREPDDEARVCDLLSERSRLERRKEALPFLLRGTQARALRAQAAALREEQASVKIELDAAELAVKATTERIAELKRQSEQAVEVLAQATRQMDLLTQQHMALIRGAGAAQGDAVLIERGDPMMFKDQHDWIELGADEV